MQIPKRLTEQQRKAQRAFAKLMGTPGEADSIYDRLADSKRGRIISADLARYLRAFGWK